MKSQNAKIAKHLQSGKKITPLTALRRYGCFRLSARINNLRQQGLNIKTDLITRNGKTFASYHL